MNPAVIVTAIVAAAIFLLWISQGGTVEGKYTFDSLLRLAVDAGFSSTDAVTAASIALAESGGDPNAYNPETGAGTAIGKGSYGLWQIYLSAHPEDANVNLYDPQTNAQKAFEIYSDAGGFTPWSTYKSGKYISFLPASGGSNA